MKIDNINIDVKHEEISITINTGIGIEVKYYNYAFVNNFLVELMNLTPRQYIDEDAVSKFLNRNCKYVLI